MSGSTPVGGPGFALTDAEAEAAVALLRELVQIDTVNPPGHEARAAAVIARWLEEAGIPASVHTFAPERANLTARLPRSNGAGKTAAGDGVGSRQALVFSGHTDTVPTGERPWQRDPWSADIEGGRLYGRGAADMKSGLAAMVMAMICLHRRGAALPRDLLLAVSAGEEVDCVGARQLVADGVLADAAGIVIGEPTGGEIVTAHKGTLWLELTTEGRTAHGAMPQKGINAIMRMHEVITRLQTLSLGRHSHPLLGPSTMSLNTIQGGMQTNVVPDRCVARLDIRTVPGQRHADVLAEIEAVLADLDWIVGIAVLHDLAPVGTAADAPLVQAALHVAREMTGREHAPAGAVYYTDAAIYQPALGVPVVLYGPGEPRQAHQPNESVDIAAFLAAIRFYAELAQASWD